MENIHDLLDSIPNPGVGLYLKKNNQFFWGKTSTGDIVYGFESKNVKLTSLTQSTKYLKIFLNTPFDIVFDDCASTNNLSLIMLKKEGINFLDLFIRLTTTIKSIPTDQELLAYFLNLRSLFSNNLKKSIKELQGLYGELYLMVFLKKKFNLNINKYYQSEDKRKFDFSISEFKKIEVKTTTLPVRIHRFKLEQLDTLRCKIIIASIMLQKDDCGLSLYELIGETKKMFANDLRLMLHIENMIRNIDNDVLEAIKYNSNFASNNVKLFNANNIPSIKEKTADGVFNVEFDSDLSSAVEFNINDLYSWIEN